MKYPKNVCVHGNGFIQINLGGLLPTRIHIWTKDLDDLTQTVNTRMHNHRFGFTSQILKGAMIQRECTFRQLWHDNNAVDDSKKWTRWQCEGDRLPTGNRPLVKRDGEWMLMGTNDRALAPGHVYTMEPRKFHVTVPLVFPVVTLMTKTQIIPRETFNASVFCRKDLEPDQEYDREQIPFEELWKKHIQPALYGTPFRYVEPVPAEGVMR